MTEPDSPVSDELRREIQMLTAPQVCELLAVKQEWLWEACRENRIPHIKLGRQIRFLPADLITWVQQQRRLPDA